MITQRRLDEALNVGEHIQTVRDEEGEGRAVEVCLASIAASVAMLEDIIGPMRTGSIMIGIARRSVSFKRNDEHASRQHQDISQQISTPLGR